MFNRDIELRLMHIIHLDQTANKQLAIKTKNVNRKLHIVSTKNEEFQRIIFEKKRQLQLSERNLSECQKLSIDTATEQIRIKQQIKRLKKKKNQDESSDGKRCDHITLADRNIYSKKLLKLSILRHCTKLFFSENKSHNRITLKGYVCTEDELYPFENKYTLNSEQTEDSAILWDNIKFGSKHLDKWDQLFSFSLDNDYDATF